MTENERGLECFCGRRIMIPWEGRKVRRKLSCSCGCEYRVGQKDSGHYYLIPLAIAVGKPPAVSEAKHKNLRSIKRTGDTFLCACACGKTREVILSLGGVTCSYKCAACADTVAVDVEQALALPITKVEPHMYSEDCLCDNCSKWHEPKTKKTLDIDKIMAEVMVNTLAKHWSLPIPIPVSWTMELIQRAGSVSAPSVEVLPKCNKALAEAREGKMPWASVDPSVALSLDELTQLCRSIKKREA